MNMLIKEHWLLSSYGKVILCFNQVIWNDPNRNPLIRLLATQNTLYFIHNISGISNTVYKYILENIFESEMEYLTNTEDIMRAFCYSKKNNNDRFFFSRL